MADINARFPHARQRHLPGSTYHDSVEVDGSFVAERSQEYDQALKQSRLPAVRRRGGMTGSGGSVMNMSTLLATGPAIGASVFIDPANAPSVTLGDSLHESQRVASTSAVTLDVPREDIVADGGVGSNLGESYVDGAHRYGGFNREDEEEDGVEDGGVLGLLAQIYGRRDGPPVGF